MKITGRKKENESECLNKLVQMGFLEKEEIDEKIYYKI
jgi:Fe2+ transport system protein FeoA